MTTSINSSSIGAAPSCILGAQEIQSLVQRILSNSLDEHKQALNELKEQNNFILFETILTEHTNPDDSFNAQNKFLAVIKILEEKVNITPSPEIINMLKTIILKAPNYLHIESINILTNIAVKNLDHTSTLALSTIAEFTNDAMLQGATIQALETVILANLPNLSEQAMSALENNETQTIGYCDALYNIIVQGSFEKKERSIDLLKRIAKTTPDHNYNHAIDTLIQCLSLSEADVQTLAINAIKDVIITDNPNNEKAINALQRAQEIFLPNDYISILQYIAQHACSAYICRRAMRFLEEIAQQTGDEDSLALNILMQIFLHSTDATRIEAVIEALTRIVIKNNSKDIMEDLAEHIKNPSYSSFIIRALGKISTSPTSISLDAIDKIEHFILTSYSNFSTEAVFVLERVLVETDCPIKHSKVLQTFKKILLTRHCTAICEEALKIAVKYMHLNIDNPDEALDVLRTGFKYPLCISLLKELSITQPFYVQTLDILHEFANRECGKSFSALQAVSVKGDNDRKREVLRRLVQLRSSGQSPCVQEQANKVIQNIHNIGQQLSLLLAEGG